MSQVSNAGTSPPRTPSKGGIPDEQSREALGNPLEITDAARVIIKQLREQVPELQAGHPLSSRFDDPYLNRFVRARKHNYPEVLIMVQNHIKWLMEMDVAGIGQFKFTELNEFREVYPHGYHGVDKLGRPIYIERYSKLNADQLFKISNMDRVSKYWVQGYEYLLYHRFPACSSESSQIVQSCVILDLSGVKLSMFDSRAREFLKRVSKISSDNYPETLGAMFVVNVPSFFSIVYSVAKPLIPPETKKKIHVVTAKHVKEELLKFIDPDQLPGFLGGNCVCDPQSPHDDKGCLRSDRGPWKQEDPKGEMDEFVSLHDGEVYDSRSFITVGDQPHVVNTASRLDTVIEKPKRRGWFCCKC
jgi:hypothetical protein